MTLTPVGVVCAATARFAAGLAVTESESVLTVKVLFVYVPTAGFVTPEITTVVAVFTGSEHEPAPALSTSVIVTVGPAVVAPVAVQFAKPAPSVIVGTAVTANPALKTAVIVDPPTRAPFVALDVKPTVHLVTAAAASVLPAKEIVPIGATAAAIVGVAFTGVASEEVLTLIVAAPVVVVFVIPEDIQRRSSALGERADLRRGIGERDCHASGGVHGRLPCRS